MAVFNRIAEERHSFGYKYTLALYDGKEDYEELKECLGETFKEIEAVKSEGFEIDGEHFDVEWTIDIDCQGLPEEVLFSEAVGLLLAYFDRESDHRVAAVQACPGRVARVTFVENGEVAKLFFEELGVRAADASAPVAQDSVVEEAEECDYSSDASDDLFPSATPVDQVPTDNISRKRSAPQTSPVSKGAVKKAQHSSPVVPPQSDICNGGPTVLLEVPEIARCSADHCAIVWEIVVDYRKPSSQRKTYGQCTSDPRFFRLRDKDI
ncbi:hypothetical protein AWC38_SpisGene9463 [Stylophora pistillata]|uniref:Uncharacterized protein n=1 Tax=Stylophora pistillata TaxID=50429 RepID=A0A2B4S9X9_STYPI|nr:hypothetical protein AWC38_SpisGene9463 [Stylophora pistillata]